VAGGKDGEDPAKSRKIKRKKRVRGGGNVLYLSKGWRARAKVGAKRGANIALHQEKPGGKLGNPPSKPHPRDAKLSPFGKNSRTARKKRKGPYEPAARGEIFLAEKKPAS